MPIEKYNAMIKAGELHKDIVQENAVQELQRLYDDLLSVESKPTPSIFQRITGIGSDNYVAPPVGVYMYGGVGRGKSMLMDLFYGCLPETIKKRRTHFHEFMIEVHNYINSRCREDGVICNIDQALPSLAEMIAKNSQILCFDEFHVVDITDAMILGRLFKMLFELDVVVVATSNWAIDDLYKGGLQRSRFLPFIELFKTKVVSVHLDSPHDYRTKGIKIEGTYFTPLGRRTNSKLDDIFNVLIGEQIPSNDIITVKGREIEVEGTANGVARFSFAQLCERPHGAEDYLEIAKRYHTVFIENIPKLGYDRRNEAKRFMNLIDALYEARVRVIISAATIPEKLYRGHDHAYEFERTVSRLLEMQSEGYP